MKIRIKRKKFVIFTYALFLLTYYCIPAVHYRLTYVPVAVASMGLILILFFAGGSIALQQFVIRIFICISVCSILYYIVPYSLNLKPAINEFQQLVMYCMPMVLAIFVLSKDEFTGAKVVLGLYLIALLIVMYKTSIALSSNATVVRALANGSITDSYINLMRFGNVGGLGFAYSMGPVFFLSLFLAVRNKGIIRVLAIAACLVIGSFVVRTQFATLFFLTISYSIIMLASRTRSIGKKILFIVFAVILFLFGQGILNYLAEHLLSSYSTLSYHLRDISGFLQGNELGSSRGERILDTLHIFLKGPIIGVFNCMIDSSTYAIMVRTHAGNISILTEIGIVGFGFYMAFFGIAWKWIHRALISYGSETLPFDISALYLITFGFVNTIGQIFELSMTIFLFIPLLLYYLRKREIKLGGNGNI